MKVYNSWAAGKVNTLLVSPGADHPENSEWMTNGVVNGQNVRIPKNFPVRFVKGVAEVDDALGRYLIDKGLAHKRPQPEVSGVHSSLVLAEDMESFA